MSKIYKMSKMSTIPWMSKMSKMCKISKMSEMSKMSKTSKMCIFLDLFNGLNFLNVNAFLGLGLTYSLIHQVTQ